LKKKGKGKKQEVTNKTCAFESELGNRKVKGLNNKLEGEERDRGGMDMEGGIWNCGEKSTKT